MKHSEAEVLDVHVKWLQIDLSLYEKPLVDEEQMIDNPAGWLQSELGGNFTQRNIPEPQKVQNQHSEIWLDPIDHEL